MSLIYADEVSGKGGGMPNLGELDATIMYMKHYENSLFLSIFLKNGTMSEKHRASKELEICDRKLSFWRRQKTYDHKCALEKMNEMKKLWDGKI